MLLLDSVYINNSGGRILLNYLVDEIENASIDCYYLFDDRCEGAFPQIPNERSTFLKAGLLARHSFYKKHKPTFSKIFCFGNLPPSVKMQVPVYTYLHQELFLKIPQTASVKDKFVFTLKSFIFKLFQRNTDSWMVQTEAMKYKLIKSVPTARANSIHILPFYPPLPADTSFQRNEHSLIYVSGGSPHKNHSTLLKGFQQFYDLQKKGELHLTVSTENNDLCTAIKTLQTKGYPIVNHGFVKREKLSGLYGSSKFLIYPSLSESFGLGIVEAIENGCDVLGADLDYLHQVCNPSLTFNPLDANSICDAISKGVNGNVKPTEQKIFNKINDLIAILKNNNENS